MKPSAPLLIAAGTFLGLEGVWALGHAVGVFRSAWILKTGAGIGVCFVVFFALAAILSSRQRASSGLTTCARPLALGAVAGIAIALAAVGPGNLWPMVLVFNGLVLAVAAFAGSALGAAFRSPMEGDDAEPETD